MDKKTQRLSKEDREDQILKAALGLFVEKGYKGTTTIDIANRAEISEVTLFRYFDSKKEIFLKCVLPVLTETLEESLYFHNDNKEVALKRFLMNRISLVSENSQVVKLILMENQVNEDFKEIDFIKTIGQIISNGINQFGFENRNQTFVKRLIMGSVLSFLYLPDEEKSIEAFVDELIGVLN